MLGFSLAFMSYKNMWLVSLTIVLLYTLLVDNSTVFGIDSNNNTDTSNDPTVLWIKPYVESFAYATLYVLLAFIAFFIIKYRNRYLDTSPEDDPINPSKQRDPAEVKEEYNEWSREQTFSATLAGFSISALVFILAFQGLSKFQTMVEFFTFGFILEMLSFLSYKYMIKRKYEYLGTALQFAGLLATFNGFFVFIMTKLFSLTILAMFVGGYVVFFIFVWQQLGSYIPQFMNSKKTSTQNLQNANRKNDVSSPAFPVDKDESSDKH